MKDLGSLTGFQEVAGIIETLHPKTCWIKPVNVCFIESKSFYSMGINKITE